MFYKRNSMDKKFLTFSEAADLLRISKPTVERLVAKRKIPSYKIGRRRLFDPEELVEWVKSHKDDKPMKSTRKKLRKKGDNRKRK